MESNDVGLERIASKEGADLDPKFKMGYRAGREEATAAGIMVVSLIANLMLASLCVALAVVLYWRW